MDRRWGMVLFGGLLLFAWSGAAPAATYLYVDSAPNVYGSPDWDPWWTQTKADVATGSFTNMRTGTYPGTTWMDPYDEIVYSTGDLGKRLHWIYWVPGATTSGLDGLFEVRWVIDWDGDLWTYDWSAYDWTPATPDAGWVQPSSWENYDADGDGNADGVIGSFGFAWWAYDDLAPPRDTGGNAYDETDQADIDALRQQVFQYQTFALGQVRTRNTQDASWAITNQVNVRVVPEPGTLLLMGSGFLGLAARIRKRCKTGGVQSDA